MRSHRRKSDGLFLFMTKKQNFEIKLAVKAITKAAKGYNQSKMYDYFLFDKFHAETITELVFDYLEKPDKTYDSFFKFIQDNNLSKRPCLFLIYRKAFENFLLNMQFENEND